MFHNYLAQGIEKTKFLEWTMNYIDRVVNRPSRGSEAPLRAFYDKVRVRWQIAYDKPFREDEELR